MKADKDMECPFNFGESHKLCDCGALPAHCVWCAGELSNQQVEKMKESESKGKE